MSPGVRNLGGGATGEVWLTREGVAAKRAWKYPWAQEDIRREVRIYKRLAHHFGLHERFLKFLDFDPDAGILSLEYMETGTLRDYLQMETRITYDQQTAWILALAQGLEMLHSVSVIHMDITPANLLLGRNLELKIADFACASVDGARPTGTGGTRFYPGLSSDPLDDIFAVGSTIYEIFTKRSPYREVCSPQVMTLYSLQQFPDLSGVGMADIIRECWMRKIASAEHLTRRVQQMHSS